MYLLYYVKKKGQWHGYGARIMAKVIVKINYCIGKFLCCLLTPVSCVPERSLVGGIKISMGDTSGKDYVNSDTLVSACTGGTANYYLACYFHESS